MMMMIATILLLKVCDIIKFDVIFHTLKQKVKFFFEILILLYVGLSLLHSYSVCRSSCHLFVLCFKILPPKIIIETQ